MNTPIQNIAKVTVTLDEESTIASTSPTGRLPTTAFGHAFLGMFNRFLQKIFDAIGSQPEERLMSFTWGNESKGRRDVQFFVDLKKKEGNFLLEIGVPGGVKEMTLNFQTMQKGNSLALMRKLYVSESTAFILPGYFGYSK